MAAMRYGMRDPRYGSTSAVKMSTSVSGVFRTISVYTVATPRRVATGEMRIAATIVPITSAARPLTISRRMVVPKPSRYARQVVDDDVHGIPSPAWWG